MTYVLAGVTELSERDLGEYDVVMFPPDLGQPGDVVRDEESGRIYHIEGDRSLRYLGGRNWVLDGQEETALD